MCVNTDANTTTVVVLEMHTNSTNTNINTRKVNPSKVFCKYPLFKVAVVVAACVQINGWLRPGCCLLLLYTYYVAIYCNSVVSDHIAIHWLWSS